MKVDQNIEKRGISSSKGIRIDVNTDAIKSELLMPTSLAEFQSMKLFVQVKNSLNILIVHLLENSALNGSKHTVHFFFFFKS